MSAPIIRSRPLAIVAAAGLVAVAIGVSWALYPAGPGPSRPAALRSRLHSPARSAPSASSRPAPGSTHGKSPAPRGTRRPRPLPGAGAQFTAGLRLGVFTAGQSLAGFDAQVGRAALAVSYVRWGTPVRWLAQVITRAVAEGAEPILELYPGSLGQNASQIAAGTGGSDAWLRGFGQMMARIGDPVAISFFPEMNGPWRASWSSGPATYVRAFRHVHQVLSAWAGSVITWFWQPSAMHNANPDPMPWWPGRSYVDEVALDGYYYFPHDDFEAIFGYTIGLVRQVAPGIPMMVGETAAGPLYGRQAWEIGNLFAGIRGHGLLGLVWFNRSQHMQPYQFHQDWRLQDNPAAVAAFRACMARYGPMARLVK